MRQIRSMVPLLIFLVFTSCSKEAFFGSPMLSEPEAKVISLSEGAVLLPAEEIPLTLSVASDLRKKDLAEPFSLLASIQTLDGTEVASARLNEVQPQNGPLPSLIPPPLQRRIYVLRISLYRGQTQTFQRNVTFFIAEEKYTLEQISHFPPSIPPNSIALLNLVLRTPPNADPWIRWTIQGRIVQEQSLSKGGKELRWVSPEREGVYPVRIDVYPSHPRDGHSFPFTSALYIESQLIVSSRDGGIERDFKPEHEYWSLFHFMGNLRDVGVRGNKHTYGRGNLKEIGSPQVRLKGNTFGYFLNGQSGFITEQLLLPFQRTEKGLGFGWSLRFSIRPENPMENRTLFEGKSTNGTFQLQLRSTEAKTLQATLQLGSFRHSFSSQSTLTAEVPQELEYTVSAENGFIDSQWVINGVPETVERVQAQFLQGFALADGGTTWIGVGEGSEGFVGMLDELGIRVRKVEQAIPLQMEGPIVQNPPYYNLSAGANLQWGPVEFSGATHKIHLPLDHELIDAVEIGIGIYRKGDPVPSWLVVSKRAENWEVSIRDRVSPLPSPDQRGIEFTVARERDGVLFQWEETSFSVPFRGNAPASFNVRVANPNESSRLLEVGNLILHSTIPR